MKNCNFHTFFWISLSLQQFNIMLLALAENLRFRFFYFYSFFHLLYIDFVFYNFSNFRECNNKAKTYNEYFNTTTLMSPVIKL